MDVDTFENAQRNVESSRIQNVLSFTQGVVPLVIAVAVLYIFWTLIKTMLGKTSVPEPEWNRALLLFGGVEALAFAAGGFVFGREVNRRRAEQAEQRAGIERQRAASAEQKATEQTTKGKALRQVIEAKKSRRDEHVQVIAALEEFRHGPHRRPVGNDRMHDVEELENFIVAEPSSSARRTGDDIDELSRVASELFP